MSEQTSHLADSLAAVQANLPVIFKGETAEVPTKDGGKYSYTYASLSDISEIVLPLLAEHGLSFIAKPTVTDTGAFVLAYSLLHVSGEREDGSYPLPNSTPQAVGSAITYARRYVLCAVTGVAPEDDDGQAAQQAATAPAPAVDLGRLEAQIEVAQSLGVEKDWEKARSYASQSQAHLDKALAMLEDEIVEVSA